MILRLLALFLFINSVSLAEMLGDSKSLNYPGASDFLDIILDDTHTYIYLNCKSCNNSGRPYSVYSSLMPKDEGVREGIEDFPKILQLLFEAGDFVAEKAIGISLYSNKMEKSSTEEVGFTFKDVLDACKFGFCYMISDYVKTAVEGRVIPDRPDPQEIRLRRRFYLTPEQAKRGMALVNRFFKDSSEGRVIYDRLKHNCVDYAKEIYEGIGLDKSEGDFLSQFGLDTDSVIFDGEEIKENSACLILKAYKIHNEGAIGFRKVVTVIWNAIKSCLGI